MGTFFVTHHSGISFFFSLSSEQLRPLSPSLPPFRTVQMGPRIDEVELGWVPRVSAALSARIDIRPPPSLQPRELLSSLEPLVSLRRRVRDGKSRRQRITLSGLEREKRDLPVQRGGHRYLPWPNLSTEEPISGRQCCIRLARYFSARQINATTIINLYPRCHQQADEQAAETNRQNHRLQLQNRLQNKQMSVCCRSI